MTDSIPVPDGLAYRQFQIRAIQYALARRGTILADEMGLGKTIEAIGLINADTNIKTVLVICPATLKLNWQAELKKWLVRDMIIGIVKPGKEGFPVGPDIVIINYDLLQKYEADIKVMPWDLLICDEAHRLKNPKAIRTKQVLGYKGIKPIRANCKLFITGTPILNRPIEPYPILRHLDPETWGSWFTYVVRYCAGYQKNVVTGYDKAARRPIFKKVWDVSGASNLEEFQALLKDTVMIRRLKKDVLKELPPKQRQIVVLPPTGATKSIKSELELWDKYEIFSTSFAAVHKDLEYLETVATLKEGQQALFEQLSKLRHDTAVAKIPQVIDHLEDALEGGKVVVFAHHLDVLHAIYDHFEDQAVILTGETPQEARHEAVERFQSDPDVSLFVGSTLAAGTGLTLTAASHVVFAELDWVPGNVTQAEDRCHRIGQEDSVLVQHLVLDGSLDAKMAKMIVEKQEIIDKALDEED